MRRQRNNIVGLPFDLRRVVNRMLVDGCEYAAINAEVRRLAPRAPKLHSSSLGAWQKSAEYCRYRAAREAGDAESAETRALAAALNDGRGPESYADLTAMEVLKALWANVKGGAVTDLDDLAHITQALAPILRAQIAAESANARKRERDLTAQIAAQDAAYEEELAVIRTQIAAKDAEIARLRNPQPEDLSGLSEAEKNKRIKERLGIN